MIYHVREEVVDSDRLCKIEFDEKSLRGVLDKFTWYPKAMDDEYCPQRVWNRKVHGGGAEKKFPPMNDARRHPFLHLTNKFDDNTNMFLLLKKMFRPRGCRDKTTRVEEKWFKHITNNVASNHWAKCTTPLLPLRHLDCAIDSDQHSFLNPTMSDCILSNLEQDSYGENAKKKRARCCICVWHTPQLRGTESVRGYRFAT